MGRATVASKRAMDRGPQTHLVTVRLAAEDHGALVAAAEGAAIPTARLVRVLVRYGLAELARGNQDLERAVKTRRDA